MAHVGAAHRDGHVPVYGHRGVDASAGLPRFAAKDLLLVLDNVEHVLPAARLSLAW